jgi:hypothetical protein
MLPGTERGDALFFIFQFQMSSFLLACSAYQPGRGLNASDSALCGADPATKEILDSHGEGLSHELRR